MFRLHGKEREDSTYFVELESCRLLVRRYLLSGSLLDSVDRRLQRGDAIHYTFPRNVIQGPYEIAKGMLLLFLAAS